MSSHFSYLLSLPMLLRSSPTSLSLFQCLAEFSQYFPVVIWWYQVWDLDLDPLWVDVCIRWKFGMLLHTSAHGDPDFLNIICWSAVFSPDTNFSLFVWDTLVLGAWTDLWSFYSVPVVYLSNFLPVQGCLDYTSTALCLKIRLYCCLRFL